ncbi:MAG: bifunctional DNA-formamidopyrimidine glycosylase/DNA-(apurinic or apyrimidinic site) lyase [Gemmatimonadaceae bacterium]
MPELPETETIARDLDGALRGAVVRSLHVTRPDVLRAVTAAALGKRLAGAAVCSVSRRAKSIVIAFERDGAANTARGSSMSAASERLVVTPRFTGSLLLDGTPDDAYTCIRIALGDGRVLRYHDVRRLGTVSLFDAPAFGDWSASLGPEPLDPELTDKRFSGIIRGSRRAVKSILMDQRRLAGVGNIYANEALWRAGIRPSRSGGTVTLARCGALLESLRAVFTESIALRGTTFRDFRDAYGERGGFADKLQAYGRAGLPCTRCGTTLKGSHAIDGRQTVWCPKCQS